MALHLHDYAGDVWIGDAPYHLEPGDFTVTPPDEPSRYTLAESGTHLCVHFFPPRNRTLRAAARVQLPLHFRLGPQTTAARERFWHVVDHFRRAGKATGAVAGHAAAAALQELLLWLCLQSRRGATPSRHNLLEQALRKMREKADGSIDRPSSIAELAAGAGLSSGYLARLFAQRYGMTLQHYLLQRRIELARHLLVSSDLLISDIGRRVGMPDPQYFNKQFRRAAGISPSAYRLSKRGPATA